ncbi:hypothetical protein [Marinicella marina]|uniref:hypothetical protein n=1 Tax=Marinicella marina TaxID=2996016 RepID=UPI0024BCF32E|nr:hypothetical protein [Marinicella marina]MDJ1139574.1 hypothetical protein [Marinicella marina]
MNYLIQAAVLSWGKGHLVDVSFITFDQYYFEGEMISLCFIAVNVAVTTLDTEYTYEGL